MRRLLAVTTATLVGAALLIPTTAHAVVPTMKLVQVERTGTAMTDLFVSWQAVPSTHHYTVSVFDGQKQTLQTVAGDQTTAGVAGVLPACSQPKVQVIAVAEDQRQTPSNTVSLSRVSPGSVSKLTYSRSENGQSVSMNWDAPADPGVAPVTGYTVEVKQLSTGQVVASRNDMGTSESVSGLDPERQYSAKVTANNKYGSCVTSTILFRNQKPSPAHGLKAWRDPSNPKKVHFQWDGPKWPGYGPVTGYEIYSRPGNRKGNDTQEIGPREDIEMDLDPDRKWSLHVRSLNGKWSKEFWVSRSDAPKPVEKDPQVQVSETNGTVTIDFVGPVGSSTKYRKMNVGIAPTKGGTGMRDSQMVANGALQVVFSQVPCGRYTVVITGIGTTANKEFARLLLVRCAT